MNKFDIYFRINAEDQNGEIQKCRGNFTKNIIHSLVLEIENPKSIYHRFLDLYSIEFFNLNQETMKLELIKKINFNELTGYKLKKEQPQNGNQPKEPVNKTN